MQQLEDIAGNQVDCEEENRANAKLIAALPDLLAALLDEVRLMRYEGREPAEATIAAIRKAGFEDELIT